MRLDAKKEFTEEDLALSVWKLDEEMKRGVWRVQWRIDRDNGVFTFTPAGLVSATHG